MKNKHNVYKFAKGCWEIFLQEKQLLHEDLIFEEDDLTDNVRAGAMFKKQVLAQVSSNREKLNSIEAKLDRLTQTLERLTK